MGDGAGGIDEECRRRFESAWRSDGAAAVADFLPDPAAPTYAATLEELLCIDLEMRTKRGDPPSIGTYARAFTLDVETCARLARERDRLARRHGAPRRVGRYELRDLLGQGAFAQVWRAFDPDLEREVALKQLRPGLAMADEARARFQREAQSAARLRHPSIVTVHEVGDDGDAPWLAADLIPGPTLAAAMRERAFAPDEAARLVARLADALDYAHQCGIVHRDVKPGNVLLDDDGRPLLSDFGLVRLAKAETTLTRQGDLLGTPAYMSPEQARGDVEAVGPRSDVYSLGVVLYELLCGELPFARDHTAAMSYAILHTDPRPPRRVRPTVPLDLDSVCRRAMAREPDRRYATAGAFADDLRRFLARESVHARPRGPAAHTALWIRRNPGLAASLALVVVVAVVGLVNVLEERARFRDQRAQAQASLYRAYLRETEAHLAAPGGTGREAAWASLRAATDLDVPARDPLVLRNLALRCLTVADPYFRVLAEWSGDDRPQAMALTPAGLVEAGPDGTRLRDPETGVVRAADPAPAVAVAYGGGRLATAHPDGIRLRDPGTLAATRTIPGEWEALAVTASRLAAVGEIVRMWAADGTRTFPHAAHCVGFSSDGARLAAGCADGRLRVWTLATGELEHAFEFFDPVRSVAFGRDLVAMAPRETYTVSVGNLTDGKRRDAPRGHESGVVALFFGTGGLLVSAAADGTLGAWNPSLERVARGRRPGGEILTAAAAGERIVTLQADGSRALWEVTSLPGGGRWGAQHAAVFLPGTTTVCTGRHGFDLPAGAGSWRALPEIHHTIVWGVDVDPVRGRLVSAGHGGEVVLRDAKTLAIEHWLQREGEVAWTAAFSPDGATVAAGTGGDIVLWDAATGEERTRIEASDRLVVALAFHPTEPVLASAAFDRTVRLWDWRTGRATKRLIEGVVVHDLAYVGRALVAACADGTLRVWNGTVRKVRVGDEPVWSVAVSPRGIVATGSQAGAIRLWDPATWTARAVLGTVPRVRALAFDDTGRYLVAAAYVMPGAWWDLDWLHDELATIGLGWR